MNNLYKNIFDIKKSKSYIEYNKYHTGNIFGITKLSRREEMHSNFIAWVLNPESSHSLYLYPLYQLVRTLKFIKEKPENENASFNDLVINKFYNDDFIIGARTEGNGSIKTTVGREIKNIDILIEIKTKDKTLPIIIENKVDSKENGNDGNQTETYFKWAEKKFNSSEYYKPIYIFLFPEYNSEVKQKCDKYLRMTYQELVDYIIEPCMFKCADINSKNNFKTYLQCLSFQIDNEKGGNSMAITQEEKRILDDFIKENKNLLLSVLNNSSLKDEIDPEVLETLTKQVRDYSKYKFQDEEYVKNRLVLAVVKKYVEENSTVDYNNILSTFPDELQGGNLGVVRKIDLVTDEQKGIGGQKRYFVGSNEIITLSNSEEIVVCNQWGRDNIDIFINHVVEKLKYVITKM